MSDAARPTGVDRGKEPTVKMQKIKLINDSYKEKSKGINI